MASGGGFAGVELGGVALTAELGGTACGLAGTGAAGFGGVEAGFGGAAPGAWLTSFGAGLIFCDDG